VKAFLGENNKISLGQSLRWNIGTWHGGVSNCHATHITLQPPPIGFSLGFGSMFARVDEAVGSLQSCGLSRRL
jgi:hypothetical protein